LIPLTLTLSNKGRGDCLEKLSLDGRGDSLVMLPPGKRKQLSLPSLDGRGLKGLRIEYDSLKTFFIIYSLYFI
jgi:hypothetical protein